MTWLGGPGHLDAEQGQLFTIWLAQGESIVNALAVLSQYLVVFLDPKAIVGAIRDGYGKLDLTAGPMAYARPYPTVRSKE